MKMNFKAVLATGVVASAIVAGMVGGALVSASDAPSAPVQVNSVSTETEPTPVVEETVAPAPVQEETPVATTPVQEEAPIVAEPAVTTPHGNESAVHNSETKPVNSGTVVARQTDQDAEAERAQQKRASQPVTSQEEPAPAKPVVKEEPAPVTKPVAEEKPVEQPSQPVTKGSTEEKPVSECGNDGLLSQPC